MIHHPPFIDPLLATIISCSCLFGATCGILGTFTFLRKQNLWADTIAHSTLPGIAVAFLISGRQDTPALLCGACISASIGVLAMHCIIKNTTLKKDSVFGVILSLFLGSGLMLFSVIHRYSKRTSGLNRFLFGNTSTVLHSDCIVMALICSLSLSIIYVFWKELTMDTFDRIHAQSMNHRGHSIEMLRKALLIITIVAGLQTMGIVLISTMLVAPPAIARKWTTRISSMSVASMTIGIACAFTGTVLSASIPNMPTGPIIVLLLTFLLCLSLAPAKAISHD